MPNLFDNLVLQPRVKAFFERCISADELSHAYLFVGPAGSKQMDCVRDIATYLVCSQGGCQTCNECQAIASGVNHPDIVFLTPASKTGYLVDQIRSLIKEAYLAPVRAKSKLFVIQDAHRLTSQTANALLKTIEEPPEHVIFIFLAPAADRVLSTIVSRCQQIPFATISEDLIAAELVKTCKVTLEQALIALSVSGSEKAACQFLIDKDRQHVRSCIIDILSKMKGATASDLIEGAARLCTLINIPINEIEDERKQAQKDAEGSTRKKASQPAELVGQAAQLAAEKDYLSTSARKEIQKSFERELSQQRQSGIMEALSAARSLLRDALLYTQGDKRIINTDAIDTIECLATTPGQIVQALAAIDTAQSSIVRNVTPQLTLEVMLFDIKESLYADRCTG